MEEKFSAFLPFTLNEVEWLPCYPLDGYQNRSRCGGKKNPTPLSVISPRRISEIHFIID
jgi:hypothetical protein